MFRNVAVPVKDYGIKSIVKTKSLAYLICPCPSIVMNLGTFWHLFKVICGQCPDVTVLDFERVRVLFVLGFKARRNLHFLHANLFVRFLELYVQRLYGNYHHIHMTTIPSSLF